MVAPVLIFAVGNESRGDDALGVLLMRELDVWIADGKNTGQFELLEDFQLQIEHALDLKDRRVVLFIDAGVGTLSPFSFYRAQPLDEPVLYSHALAPEALLDVYAQYYREAPPNAFILCVRGRSFELGEGLSPEAEENLAAGVSFCKLLLQDPESGVWDRKVTKKSMEESMAREDNQFA
jgi:hydrogenase maturation protease